MARSRRSHKQARPRQSAGEQVDSDAGEKLNALRHAARLGFDEIDQGQGIVVRGKKGLARLFRDIEAGLLRVERDCG